MTLANDNGTDGQTDRRTDRVRRNMRPPPREEGRIKIGHGIVEDLRFDLRFAFISFQISKKIGIYI